LARDFLDSGLYTLYTDHVVYMRVLTVHKDINSTSAILSKMRENKK